MYVCCSADFYSVIKHIPNFSPKCNSQFTSSKSDAWPHNGMHENHNRKKTYKQWMCHMTWTRLPSLNKMKKKPWIGRIEWVVASLPNILMIMDCGGLSIFLSHLLSQANNSKQIIFTFFILMRRVSDTGHGSLTNRIKRMPKMKWTWDFV